MRVISSYICGTQMCFHMKPERAHSETQTGCGGSFVKHVSLNKRTGRDMNSLVTTLGWKYGSHAHTRIHTHTQSLVHGCVLAYKNCMHGHLDYVQVSADTR